MADVGEEIVARVRRFPNVERLLLFGSRARGDARPRSDWDVAVVCPQASRREWLDLLESLDEIETLLSIDAIRLYEALERTLTSLERAARRLGEALELPRIGS